MPTGIFILKREQQVVKVIQRVSDISSDAPNCSSSRSTGFCKIVLKEITSGFVQKFHSNCAFFYDQGYGSWMLSLILHHDLNTLMNSDFFFKKRYYQVLSEDYVAYSLGVTFDFQTKCIQVILLHGVNYWLFPYHACIFTTSFRKYINIKYSSIQFLFV